MNDATIPAVAEIRAGDRRALARAITLLESTRADHREQAEALVTALLPAAGKSVRIGLTGVPGVGKSTLIDAFGEYLIGCGHKVAVLAVDPSSSVSGGSILGDKTRMPTLSVNPHAFIRPTPAGTSTGGVARRTSEAIVLCEAAGFDVVIVETVGVGQAETVVSDMTDIFLLMLLPGGGDELQGIKRGIMELADIVLVNKADGELLPRARLSAAEVQQALGLLKPRYPDWRVPVLLASARETDGMAEIWQAVSKLEEIIQRNGAREKRRAGQARNRMLHEARELLLARVMDEPGRQTVADELLAQVSAGRLLPAVAARQLVASLLNRGSR